MKVAHLILAHRLPEQLSRLVRRLGDDAPVVIHFDRRAKRATFEQARDSVRAVRTDVMWVRRHRCYWGGFGIVRATLECMGALIESGAHYDYAMLLSGQDYPLKPAHEIGAFLDAHRGAEFLESFPLAQPNRWTDLGGPYQAMRRVRRAHVAIRSRRCMLPVSRKPPSNLAFHGGSQWWCLTRSAVEYAHRFDRRRRDVSRYFQHTFIPDESYFQTVIAASPFSSSIAQDDLKLTIWDRPSPPFPAILTTDDVARLATSRKLFARKFDVQVDASILDVIDRRILGVVG